jgi:hypothetical protein
MSPERPRREAIRVVIECLHCGDVCEDTVAHALRVGGTHADDERVGALLDCADVCRTTARFIRRGSPVAGRTAAITADLCERVADVCGALVGDDVMATCAAVCRRCAAWCRRLGRTERSRAA